MKAQSHKSKNDGTEPQIRHNKWRHKATKIVANHATQTAVQFSNAGLIKSVTKMNFQRVGEIHKES